MSTTRGLILALAIAVFGGPLLCGQTTTASRSALGVLGPETTLVVQVRNVSSLLEKLKSSPLYRIKDRPELAGAVDEFETNFERARNQVRSEAGIDLIDDILAPVKGEVFFAVGDIIPIARAIGEGLTNLEDPDIKAEDVPVMLAWDTLSGHEKFQQGVDKFVEFARKENEKVETVDFHGGKITTFHIAAEGDRNVDRIHLGSHGGRYFLSPSRKFVEKAVVSLESGSAGGLLGKPEYQETQRLAGDSSDAFVYLNIKSVTAAINTALSANMFAFFWQKFEELFIGKSLQTVGYGVALEEKGVRSRLFAFNGGKEDGVLGWLKVEPFPPAPSPLIPEDTKNVSVVGVNLERAGNAIRQVVEIVLSFQGVAGDLDTQFEQQFGVKLQDLMRSFGSRVDMFTDPPKEGSSVGNFGLILQLKDDAVLKKVLAKVAESLGGMLQQKTYLERTVYSMGETGAEIALSMCVTDGVFIFGLEPRKVEIVVRRIGKSSAGIGDTDAFKDAAAAVKLPARVVALNYSTPDYVGETIAEALKGAVSDIGADVPSELIALVEAIGESIGSSVGYATWKDNGLFSESVTRYK